MGRKNYQLFNDCVDKVLKESGVYLLHFISALKEHPGDAWIKKYIFPGGVVPSLREMFDERFVRMWELYLSAYAATFHNGIIDLHQVLATKGINNDLPVTRWY